VELTQKEVEDFTSASGAGGAGGNKAQVGSKWVRYRMVSPQIMAS